LYVITFYSFKGGVGRTMALVNVAAELVRRGRKVLVVDFDLEAPGLETYKHLRPLKPHPGIVEYVTEYRRTNAVPNLLDFIFEAKPIGKRDGRLWVMPAGRRDTAYRGALARLDWQRLYKDEDGFLLFEDTKKAWEAELKPDYVLIDSRTGDTDVLGICTRQLPNSVVVMFTPNEQNLAGLENVCRDIRHEATEGLQKTIRLHFVAANVPDLDDEKRILSRQLQAFKERLDFKYLAGVIRRYENLTLLDQSIFTLDRPHSRLARSYRRLLRTLLKDNLADRDGALVFLHDYPARIETRVSGDVGALTMTAYAEGEDARVIGKDDRDVALEDKNALYSIARYFNDDVRILTKVAECFIKEEAYKSASSVLDRVLQVEPSRAYSFFRRAICKTNLGEIDAAADDLLACLRQLGPKHVKSSDPDLLWPGTSLGPMGRYFHDSGLQQECVKRICQMAPSKLAKLAEMVEENEIDWFDNQIGLEVVASHLCRRDEGVPIAARLLRNQLDNASGMALLRARCWREIIQLHEAGSGDNKADLTLALAHWGEYGEMPESLCRQALGSDDEILRDWGLQGVALLLWRVGELAQAFECLDKAEQRAQAQTEEIFSWWWLRDVTVEHFLDDCRLLRRMFQGEPLRPAFLGPAPTST
jgi:cellulose biosynthesis protein BcsQ